MKQFDFPTNVKQIGAIDPGLKIYMEDYVYNYLNQYAQAAGYDERLATLVGRYMFIDSSPVIFISGAILGKYTEEENGLVKFSSRSFDYVQEQIDTHFKGMEILGWMQSQPGYGTILNPNYKSYHQQYFGKAYQVMFIMDPLEKINSFYINNNGNLAECSGYFIYYEKNHYMHEYMLENKILKTMRGMKEEQEYPFVNNQDKPDVIREIYQEREKISPKEEENIVTLNRVKKQQKRGVPQRGQRRVANLLLSMGSVVLLISFVMAAALIRSEDRLNTLEQELVVLTNAYVSIIQSLQATQEAFAMQGTGIVIEEDGAALQAMPSPEPDQAQTLQTPPQVIPSIANLPQTYIVQQGDNLLAISQMFYGTTEMVEHIMYLNNIEDPNMIFQGMILLLPNTY